MTAPGETAGTDNRSGEGGRWDAPLTEQALEQILTSGSIDAAAAVDNEVERDLPGYLTGLMEARGLSQADVGAASDVGYQRVYDILHRSKGIGRNGALALAFTLHCSLRETQRLLWHAKAERLYARNRRDAIIIYALDHRMTLAQANTALYEFGEPTISNAK